MLTWSGTHGMLSRDKSALSLLSRKPVMPVWNCWKTELDGRYFVCKFQSELCDVTPDVGAFLRNLASLQRRKVE